MVNYKQKLRSFPGRGTKNESENIKFAQNSGILDSHSYSDIIQLNVYAL